MPSDDTMPSNGAMHVLSDDTTPSDDTDSTQDTIPSDKIIPPSQSSNVLAPRPKHEKRGNMELNPIPGSWKSSNKSHPVHNKTSSDKTTMIEGTSFNLPKHLQMKGKKILVKSYKQYWKGNKYAKGEEPSAENSGRTPRILTPFEQAGNNIMITVKTTVAYHRTRIQLLLDTWISTTNASNVFLVTDGDDLEYEAKARDIGKL